jgi:lipopolysaccharide transport system ATP-binding protein
MSSIIEVENISKQFIIGHEANERYTTLRDEISKRAKDFFSFSNRGTRRKQHASKEIFFALKDVSFRIEQGDRLGIIGRNGAGKSTLLKILSRITEPSSGKIKIKGRVASLLEVGTGFHPELTGRENIFLNGAILGMSRTEIRRKFDEIVAFADIEKFLDTPVKRYSSGMYVRLAFAVAAHLEPEILIVDEVLAVGDMEFQKKCIGKMEDVSKNEGRTVIFVSHNMGVIKTLCNNGILLVNGLVSEIGSLDLIVPKYLNSSNEFRNVEYVHQE